MKPGGKWEKYENAEAFGDIDLIRTVCSSKLNADQHFRSRANSGCPDVSFVVITASNEGDLQLGNRGVAELQ